MAYEHDVFVSYKRDLETLHWLGEHFVPLLAHRLSLELGREVDIYVHEITAHITPGASWPLELGRELASSRTLIALWTRTYFNSRWCTEEMCRMLAREKETGCRTAENSYGLVVPMVIHDGEDFPQDLEHVQRIELKRVYNTRMRRDSARAEELSDIFYCLRNSLMSCTSMHLKPKSASTPSRMTQRSRYSVGCEIPENCALSEG